MARKNRKRMISAILTCGMMAALFSGCGASKEKEREKEAADTITVYLWSNVLYEKYAP